jgi:hypothetical protein
MALTQMRLVKVLDTFVVADAKRTDSKGGRRGLGLSMWSIGF